MRPTAVRSLLRLLIGFSACIILFQNCAKTESPDQTLALNPEAGKALPAKTYDSLTAFPENYPKTNLSWGESYYQSKLLLEFQKTRDVNVLMNFWARAEAAIAKRDDKMNRLTRAPTWSTLSLYEPQFNKPSVVCSDAGLDGMILNPFAEFLYLTKERPEIFTQIPTDVLQAHQTELESAIKEVLAYHAVNSWNASLGTYRPHQSCRQVDSRNRDVHGFERLPFNLIAAMGQVHFKLYVFNQDAGQLARAKAIAQDLKKWFKTTDGALHWPYFYLDSDPEDRSHGAIVYGFIRLLAEHGVVFGAAELSGLEKTLTSHIMSQPSRVMHYIGARTDIHDDDCTTSAACRDLALWLPATTNKPLTQTMRSLVHADNGGFGQLAQIYSEIFSRAKKYGESCTFDGECETGSCYAHKICGYKLGYGSTCSHDSDCVSGQCYAGKICGFVLGSGSTCTRHHECVSGRCEVSNGVGHCE